MTLGSERVGVLSLAGVLRSLEIDADRPETIPFAFDATGGAENEYQVAVEGSAEVVDLPRTIRQSNYFANVIRRAVAGDTPRRAVTALEAWLAEDPGIWENSWVRIPLRTLNPLSRRVFDLDLRRDKRERSSLNRSDAKRFRTHERGEPEIRIPVSYLLKLALADAIGVSAAWANAARKPGQAIYSCFTNDNTSPETCSFHVARLSPANGCGTPLARETAKRYLFCQLLVQYANEAFELKAGGQRVVLFESPLPPVRQRSLNEIISDSFYRELFVSPCLSGWDRGEEKRDYMALCHRTLSVSQLNAVGKLQEAGIITRNLVVLPNTSNVSLSNNGVHVSLGSERLTERLAAGSRDHTPESEKLLGDLVIKIVEHFLPLFTGAYSAAPHRMGFTDFHPERALGYLPHELDFTHLRMLWRRWRGKSRNQVFGWPVSPLGPDWIDRAIAGVFRLRGDFVPDFRLMDYLVAPMSTERSPALDGTLGAGEQLLDDLDGLGVFDRRMALYSFYRLRDYATRGFTGFEGRFYSLFPSVMDDMRHAVNLQLLVTALAWRLIAAGRISHAQIPDRTEVESERRQIVFAAAIGLPTFYVDSRTGNAFLRELLQGVQRTRSSRRYPGRTRVYLAEYRRALLRFLEEEGRDLVEAMGLEETLADLARRLDRGAGAAADEKLTAGILGEAGARDPFQLSARDFNRAAETHYRNAVRRRRLEEGLDELEADCRNLDAVRPAGLGAVLQGDTALGFLAGLRRKVLQESLGREEAGRLIALMLLIESAHEDRVATAA